MKKVSIGANILRSLEPLNGRVPRQQLIFLLFNLIIREECYGRSELENDLVAEGKEVSIMAENEEKGFVFKDRRKLFSEEEKENKKDKPPKEGKEDTGRQEKEAQTPPPPPPLPEVNFSTFIVSLSTEVMFHLGEIPHPVSGERKKDLPLAKHTIDTLAMLKEKTAGNLTEEEQRLLDGMLYDLRMAFIRAS
jgi:hypothetical protein